MRRNIFKLENRNLGSTQQMNTEEMKKEKKLLKIERTIREKIGGKISGKIGRKNQWEKNRWNKSMDKIDGNNRWKKW